MVVVVLVLVKVVLVVLVVMVVLVVVMLVVLAVVLAVVLRPAAVSAAVSVWRVLLALPQDWPQRLRSQRTTTRLRLRCRLRLPDIAISRSNEKSPFGGFSFSAADFLVPVRPGDGFFSILEVCHGCSTGGVI